MKSLLSMLEPPAFDRMRTALVAVAAGSQRPKWQALAHFALFEGIRLNLVLMARWFPHETSGVGLEMSERNQIAEARISEWLAAAPEVPADVRLSHLIMSATMQTLSARPEKLRAGLVHLQRDFFEAIQRRAKIEEVLSEMGVRDALLIRNELSPELNEQRLRSEHLLRNATLGRSKQRERAQVRRLADLLPFCRSRHR